jgi:hypothetical protein
MLLPSLVTACDVCGVFVGIQPYDRTNSFSLIHRSRHLQGYMPVRASGHEHLHGQVDTDVDKQHVRDLLRVAELRADIWIGQRFNVLGVFTAANNYRAVDGFVSNDVYGVGDPMVLARYLLVNTRSNGDADRTAHRVMIGAGVKAPVGNSAPLYRGEPVPMEQQLGTGSWDALGSLEYMVRKRRNGIALNMIGRRSGTASDGHCMGHSLSTTLEVFHRFQRGEDWRMMPSAGIYHEAMTNMLHEGVALSGTGGSTLFTHIALRAWYRNWGVQAIYQPAVLNQLGPLMVPNRERVILGITYNLTTN